VAMDVDEGGRAPASDRPRVVILGGGFAGLYAAKALRRAPVDVVLVDRQNHHLFQPLLYQVATAGLSGPHIASPIRKILRRASNAEVLYAEARSFDLERRRLKLDRGELAYDVLILAPGATHSYFGHPEWAEHAPGLKTLADAVEIRTRIIRAFEEAEREDDPERRRACLTFAIVGGGPTGVELAGAIAELARHTLPRDFRRFDPRTAEVLLVEGSDRVLPTYPPELSEKARRQLERLGVTVRTGARVTDVRAGAVAVGDETIRARTILWGAGVQASPLLKELGVPMDRAGRVLVRPDLSVPGHPEVFVAGDAAALEQDGRLVPGVAPAAIQMGRSAAANALRLVRGEPTRPFRYGDKVALATIGRSAAVADFGRVRVSGTLAWLLWLFVHIMFLIGFRSRAVTLFDWAWSWLTYQKVARVIAEPVTAREDGVEPG
jgi:NADH:quinone reductase (non-electrogenic)